MEPNHDSLILSFALKSQLAPLHNGEQLFIEISAPAGAASGFRPVDSISQTKGTQTGQWTIQYTSYSAPVGDARYAIRVGIISLTGSLNEVPGSPFSMDVISGDISAANSVPRHGGH